jgi:hypothetical protein
MYFSLAVSACAGVPEIPIMRGLFGFDIQMFIDLPVGVKVRAAHINKNSLIAIKAPSKTK